MFASFALVAACAGPSAEGEGDVGEGEGEGEGEGDCDGHIVVDPAACDFGVVDVGAEAFCDLAINNSGACELVVTDISFSDETPFPDVFSFAQPLPEPTTVPAGSTVSLRVVAHPVDATTSLGALVIDALDPGTPTTDVPLTVTGR